MALSISGASSMNATNLLSRRNHALDLTLVRLSTAERINRAADDPAGLVISEQLAASLGGTYQAQDNISTGISMLQTADGALDGTAELLQRQRSLALQASNTAVLDDSQKQALDTEFRNLSQAIDRIAQGTRFATTPLLDGSYQGRTLQTGPEAGQTVDVTIASTVTGTPAGFDSAGLGLDGASLLTDPTDALARIDAAINEVSTQRGNLGALQSGTLESLSRNLDTSAVNLTSAVSAIRDTDMAAAASDLLRSQILMQSGVAALAQQNQSAGRVLSLLA